MIRIKSLILIFFLLIIYVFSTLTYSFCLQTSTKTKTHVLEQELDNYGLDIKEQVVDEQTRPVKEKKVSVKKFIFEGNKVLNAEFLEGLLSSYINKELSPLQIKWACEKINQEYHKRGYLVARAVPPSEDDENLKQGIIRIAIVDEDFRTDQAPERIEPVKVPVEELFSKQPNILVNRFMFDGNKIVSTDLLNKLVSNYSNRELSFMKLKWACEEINQEYQKRGYLLARAILPAQEVSDVKQGIIKISIQGEDFGIIEEALEEPVKAEEPVKIQEPARMQEPVKPPEPVKIQEPVKPPEAAKQAVFVSKFTFKGNKVLSAEYLNSITLKYIGRELTVAELKKVCNDITKEYHKNGFPLAKAVLPEQGIKQGVVNILILEGELGSIEVKGGDFYNEDFIKRNLHVDKKGLIDEPSLIKSLLLLNENINLKVNAILKKGAQPKTTDIAVKAEDKLPVKLSVDYNNYGTKYNSRHRLGATSEIGNLIVQGSKLSLRGVCGITDENLWFGKGGYEFPVNTYGTKLGLSYLQSNFDIGEEFKILNAKGKSHIYSSYLTHPIIRTQATSLDILAGFDYKNIETYLLDVISTDDELGVFKTGLTLDHVDNLNGKNIISSTFYAGAKTNNDNASRADAADEFTKLELDFVRMQQLPGSFFLISKASGQMSSEALPISEQIYAGGASTVRGYPSAELLGDYGYLGSLELRAPVPFVKDEKFKRAVQLVGFIDYAKTFLKNPQPGEEKHSDILGIGPGLRLDIYGISVSVDWGFSVGRKKASTDESSYLYIRADKDLL
ncbi:MAG: POTRA domain-containing protein [Candidatus Omnitrophota bacterium]